MSEKHGGQDRKDTGWWWNDRKRWRHFAGLPHHPALICTWLHVCIV